MSRTFATHVVCDNVKCNPRFTPSWSVMDDSDSFGAGVVRQVMVFMAQIKCICINIFALGVLIL